jgi:hypothetical protein
MKISAMFMIALTTLILFTVVVFSAMNLPFSWVFLLTTVGQIFLLVSVYRILKDDYTTDKTFDDFYEDHPIGDNYR